MTVCAKHIIVHGRVQGVGFRYFVQNIGRQLNLVGNVSNSPDMTVDIIVEGERGKVADFIKVVEKGPSLSRVQRIDVLDIPVQGKYNSFLIEGW